MDSKLVGSAKEEKCLEELKEIVKKNSEEFENFEWLLDDKFLLHFVRGKKYKIAKASIALKNYIRIRKHQYKPLFLQLDNFEESTIGIRNGAVSVLRHRDAFERTIVVINFTFWPDDMTVDQFTQALVLVTEECWNCQKVETQGVQLIVDLCSFGWNHLKMFTPSVVYKCVNIFWAS
ncbi:Retinaldehyde-binding protein 1 [Folsomia candida]|uniref:Retinaldehyde-binding protein 1 n=1 Tax=Folsomia candida TaxID=158441 RepID=A0A226EN92_FOLCA|nr:Retinaldehyde-binding protein 1 [Folsomia candida]